MTEIKLFPEKEMFVKERPTKLTESLKKEFHLKMAKEIIDEGWSNYSPESIADDLSEIMHYDSGFDAAKRLEDRGNASYDFPLNFLEWLEDFNYYKDKALESLVKEWVKIHEIKPNFQKGTKLIVNIDLGQMYKFGAEIYITGIKEETACYLVWNEIDHNGGYVVAFERVENSCAVI